MKAAAASTGNSDDALQCRAWVQRRIMINQELWRQEGQTDSAGKEKGNAVHVGTESGPAMQGRYETDEKNPLPRETRVTHFGGTTPF
jgi:hypothetical protein